MKKAKRSIVFICVTILIIAVSHIIVLKTKISTCALFDPTCLFTYFGVLIGFALTIYTFGLSMVSEINQKIEDSKVFNDQKKESLHSSLVDGFAQIKQDIWLIFYSILVIIASTILKEIPCLLSIDIPRYKAPETINLALFITTTIAMWDIMQTLFNLSEISFALNKRKNKD